MAEVKIEESWYNALKPNFEANYFLKLSAFLKEEKKKSIIYPPGSKIFAAFNQTPFNKVKVVLLGQDPYHGPNQANGLAFSVNPGQTIPPSLKNIFKELENDLGHPPPAHGDLSAWCNQGVLLLNTVLTVRHKSPGSHQNMGWENFTNAVIQALQARQQLVYILWGKSAQAKKNSINSQENLILESPHPSPFSAHRGFFGSQPFSKTNAYLQHKGKATVQWQIV
jgi:uracil-DNA glycosylase